LSVLNKKTADVIGAPADGRAARAQSRRQGVQGNRFKFSGRVKTHRDAPLRTILPSREPMADFEEITLQGGTVLLENLYY
jgi:hypothetical protein